MELPESTLGLLRWIGFAQRKAADDWSRSRDLSMEQAFTIGWLVDNPGAMQRDVAEMTRTTPASVSSLLQGLEKRGLVERRTVPGDDRSKRVFVTEAARELVAGFDVAMAATDDLILDPLSEPERDTLRALLKKIAAELPEPTRS